MAIDKTNMLKHPMLEKVYLIYVISNLDIAVLIKGN
jgi:hypothetical protein